MDWERKGHHELCGEGMLGHWKVRVGKRVVLLSGTRRKREDDYVKLFLERMPGNQSIGGVH